MLCQSRLILSDPNLHQAWSPITPFVAPPFPLSVVLYIWEFCFVVLHSVVSIATQLRARLRHNVVQPPTSVGVLKNLVSRSSCAPVKYLTHGAADSNHISVRQV